MINVPRETSQRLPDACRLVFHVKHYEIFGCMLTDVPRETFMGNLVRRAKYIWNCRLSLLRSTSKGLKSDFSAGHRALLQHYCEYRPVRF